MSSARLAPTPGTIADQLRQRLLDLEYPEFARCLCVLLEALGYEEAQPAGRREWKGYNRPGGGGYDLEAVLPGGLSPRRVVAQIKQFDGLRVHQRSVDEVRGACLRAGAAEALLITTSAFSEVVRKRAASPDPLAALVAPVRMIDGMELLSLMIRHRLGVRERVRGGTVRLEIDEAFFIGLSTISGLSASASAAAPGEAKMRRNAGKLNAERMNAETLKRWRIVVRISSDQGLSDAVRKDGLRKRKLQKGGR